MTSTRTKTFLALGDDYLNDADNATLSPRSRAELAFDAIYMYAMCLQDESAAGLEHPHPDVLFTAAAKLNMPPENMMAAVRHLNDRRSQLRHEEQLTELMQLAAALRMRLHGNGLPDASP